MFNAFSKLGKAALGVATLPVDIAADIITVGGMLTDAPRLYTVKKAKKIMRHLDDATD